jgi:serine/threonine protein phosphatase PrpC
MNFIVSARTDIGLTKSTNQDSLSIRVVNTPQGRMVFAVLCDGMGGLSKGEVASAAVINAFDQWLRSDLPALCNAPLEDSIIRAQWTKIVTEQNKTIKNYGARQGVKLGTTVVAILLTQNRYYILNVGDSRAYEISEGVKQLTNDQTFVAREVALGNMTEAQAMVDERRSVLLQCVGASDEVYPDLFFGQTHGNAVYMLCSDGFRHEISPEEIYEKLNPNVLLDEYMMNTNAEALIELNKARKERDNISVAMVRTF